MWPLASRYLLLKISCHVVAYINVFITYSIQKIPVSFNFPADTSRSVHELVELLDVANIVSPLNRELD